MNPLDQVVIVIPSYQPEQPLEVLLPQLRQAGFSNIVVVNDGSRPECNAVFRTVEAAGAIVVHHQVNQGKGQALKTAFKFALKHFSNASGVITCDADGQHLVADILAVTNVFLRNQASLVLGVREFDSSKVPLRSQFGNILTRFVFRMVVGKKLTDTQTGLRAIPMERVRSLLALRTVQYDFELDMLLSAFRSQVPVQQVSIRTVYNNNNENSHFKVIQDSARIYLVFIRFLLASILSAAIDFVVFFVVQYATGHVLASMALARLTAGSINFFISRNFTFESRGPIFSEFVKYWSLVIFYLFVSYSLVSTLASQVGMNVFVGKLVAEGTLFVLSFLIQRTYVFNSSNVPVVRPEHSVSEASVGMVQEPVV